MFVEKDPKNRYEYEVSLVLQDVVIGKEAMLQQLYMLAIERYGARKTYIHT